MSKENAQMPLGLENLNEDEIIEIMIDVKALYEDIVNPFRLLSQQLKRSENIKPEESLEDVDDIAIAKEEEMTSSMSASLTASTLIEFAVAKLLSTLLGRIDQSSLSAFVKLNLLTHEQAARIATMAESYLNTKGGRGILGIIMSGYLLQSLRTIRDEDFTNLLIRLGWDKDAPRV